MRIVLTLCACAFAATLGWFGWWSYAGARYEAARTVSEDGWVGLSAATMAHQRFPYPAMTRRQLSASFVNLIHTYAGRVTVEPGFADAVWQIGLTVSPHDTTVLFSRYEYLANFGREAETGPIIERLKRVAANLPNTWLAVAYHEALQGNVARAQDAARTGLGLRNPDVYIIERLNQLANIKVEP